MTPWQRNTLIALFAGAASIATPAGAAKLKGYAWVCSEKGSAKALCYWHKAVVAAPKGWVENESWTRRYKAMVMFPGGDASTSQPVMYVRAHLGDAAQDLDNYITVAQTRWKQRLADSTIEPLADVTRPGKPTFKVYLYKNPSQADQAFELTAFTKDTHDDHPDQTYFFQVVLSAPSLATLERAKSAFYDVLSRI